jgi:hypothetical protein
LLRDLVAGGDVGKDADFAVDHTCRAFNQRVVQVKQISTVGKELICVFDFVGIQVPFRFAHDARVVLEECILSSFRLVVFSWCVLRRHSQKVMLSRDK